MKDQKVPRTDQYIEIVFPLGPKGIEIRTSFGWVDHNDSKTLPMYFRPVSRHPIPSGSYDKEVFYLKQGNDNTIRQMDLRPTNVLL